MTTLLNSTPADVIMFFLIFIIFITVSFNIADKEGFLSNPFLVMYSIILTGCMLSVFTKPHFTGIMTQKFSFLLTFSVICFFLTVIIHLSRLLLEDRPWEFQLGKHT